MSSNDVIHEGSELIGLQKALNNNGFDTATVRVNEYHDNSFSWSLFVDTDKIDDDDVVQFLKDNGFVILEKRDVNLGQIYNPEYGTIIEAGVKPVKAKGYNKMSKSTLERRALRQAATKNLNIASVMKTINGLRNTLLEAKTQAMMVAGELEELRLSQDVAVNSIYSEDGTKLDYAIQACEQVATQMDGIIKMTEVAKSAMRGEINQTSKSIRSKRSLANRDRIAQRLIRKLR